jgi:hypothetical protein
LIFANGNENGGWKERRQKFENGNENLLVEPKAAKSADGKYDRAKLQMEMRLRVELNMILWI